MTLKMTLSQDLVEELGEAVEQIPTSMGTDVVLAVVSALGPSLTIATTALFSPVAFRNALHHWCKHSPGPVHISVERGQSKVTIDLPDPVAAVMAREVAEFVAKFLATHPDGPADQHL